jgi:hypothetical protein
MHVHDAHAAFYLETLLISPQRVSQKLFAFPHMQLLNQRFDTGAAALDRDMASYRIDTIQVGLTEDEGPNRFSSSACLARRAAHSA